MLAGDISASTDGERVRKYFGGLGEEEGKGWERGVR
jgi:hypothetical protein